MHFYIRRSNGSLVQFFGMTQETIMTMLDEQGVSYTFIDEATYNAELIVQNSK